MSSDHTLGAVQVRYDGRLGNRLAQYCLGRIVADELGFALFAPPLPGFPGAQAVAAQFEGRLAPGDLALVKGGHRVDLHPVLADRRPRLVMLKGLFLRYEYFRPHKEAIRESWLRAGTPADPFEEDVLTIHVRAGDIWRPDGGKGVNPEYHALPFSFYADVVQRRSWKRVVVVTEDPGDLMVQKLRAAYDATVLSSSAVEDFARLRASTNLVLSVSSFAWWAAWLSRARRIYVPVAGLFDPGRAARRPWRMQQDLWVNDEDRYQAITPRLCDRDWTGTPEDRARLLES